MTPKVESKKTFTLDEWDATYDFFPEILSYYLLHGSAQGVDAQGVDEV